jgi:hypothetical protein
MAGCRFPRAILPKHPYDNQSLQVGQSPAPLGLGACCVEELRKIVTKYLALAGAMGRAVPLSAFGLPPEEATRLFSALDEDYQISRYLKLTRQSGVEYSINGFPQTHVAFDPAVETLL